MRRRISEVACCDGIIGSANAYLVDLVNWWVISVFCRFHKCVFWNQQSFDLFFFFFVDICRKIIIVKLLSWSVSFKDNSLLYTSAFAPDWGWGGDYYLKMILFKWFYKSKVSRYVLIEIYMLKVEYVSPTPTHSLPLSVFSLCITVS